MTYVLDFILLMQFTFVYESHQAPKLFRKQVRNV